MHYRPIVFAIAVVFSAPSAFAQDPVKLAPQLHNVKLDNDKVRVYELKAKAGDKIPMHQHPDHVIYVLAPSKVKVTSPDGKSQVLEAKPGETLWMDSQSHISDFVGDTHILVVEMKKAGPKK